MCKRDDGRSGRNGRDIFKIRSLLTYEGPHERVYVYGALALFFSRVISLLCYPCFRDLCQEIMWGWEKERSWTPTRYPQTSLKPDSYDTSQKENFLFHINFPPKIIWLYNTVCKAQANRNSRAKVFLSVTKHLPPSLVERKVFSSLYHPHDSSPFCVKFNYSSPLYLWHFKASTTSVGRAEYHNNVCINEIHIKTIS